MDKSLRALTVLAFAMASIAALAFFFHDIESTPQTDIHVIKYSDSLLKSFDSGTTGDFMLEMRKYPLFYTVSFSVARKVTEPIFMLPVLKDMPLYQQLYVVGRLFTLIFAIGIIFVLFRLSKMFTSKPHAAILMASSILFIVFSTAIRPHIPVAFWALLSFMFAEEFKNNKSDKWKLFASYASALVAFGTLQNGVFAFLFPLWVQTTNDKRTWIKAAITLAVCISLAIILGYPFVFNTANNVGLDLGHNYGNAWDGYGFVKLGITMLGSELILGFFAILSIVKMIKNKKADVINKFAPAIVFVAAIFLIFGMYGGTASRFFIITLPFLALIGAISFKESSRTTKIIVLIFIIVLNGRFAQLALKSNTYQIASNYLNENTDGILGTDLPFYYLSVPFERFASEEQEHMIEHIVTNAGKHNLEYMTTCHKISSSKWKDNMFLWTEVPWGLFKIWQTEHFGPNLEVLCKT